MAQNTCVIVGHDDTIKWEKDGKLHCLHIQRDDTPLNPRTDWDNITIMACWHRRYDLGDKIEDKEPEDFWKRLVRENLSEEEILQAVVEGKCPGIRVAQNSEDFKLVDIYATSRIETPLGSSEASEDLEYEGVFAESAAYYMGNLFTIQHCMALLADKLECLPLWLYDHSGITMSCGARVYPYNDQWDSSQVGWIVALKDTIIKECCATEENWREKAQGIMKADVEVYDQYLTDESYGYTMYEADLPEDPDDTPDWEEGDSVWGFFGDDLLKNGIAAEVDIIDILTSGDYEMGTATRNTYTVVTF